jgi:cysteinyl-tRNA synthetase
MKLFNSLTKQIDEIKPINDYKIRVYTCGPTVYSYVTIGNWRTYTLSDLIVRALQYNNFETDFVMNITDVGHLTGDNLGDASTGDDRLEKAAAKEGRSAWDIAKFYTNDFYRGYGQLNLVHPRVWCKATDHIEEQIEMVKTIEEKGLAYRIEDGIYFDTKGFEAAGNKYGELSNLDQVLEGARVEPNPAKKDPRDFALWKFSPKGEKRQMEWSSPWGTGFPGWHIECSAMSIKYLGDQFELHIGGEDLRSTHHPNEIAQAEAATGKKPFVKYWVHGAFLVVDNGRMGKSLGNAYTVKDITYKGYDPLALRYFYMSGSYRRRLNFTWESLQAAANSLNRLNNAVADLKQQTGDTKGMTNQVWKEKFLEKINDDLNMPGALAVIWDLIKEPEISQADKLATLLDFDSILGFKLDEVKINQIKFDKLDVKIQEMIKQRENARKEKDYRKADVLRQEIENAGFQIEDSADGIIIRKK